MNNNLLCAILNIIPGTSGNDIFPEDCPAVDSTFRSLATVIIVLVTTIGLFFR